LTVTEDARAGYVVSDIYTIPAGRLISKNLSTRSAKVTIVEGISPSQTIVVFVNRAVTALVAPDGASAIYGSESSSNTVQVGWQDLWEVILGSNQRNRFIS
jgi:hypothetical protein